MEGVQDMKEEVVSADKTDKCPPHYYVRIDAKDWICKKCGLLKKIKPVTAYDIHTSHTIRDCGI